MCIIPVGCRVGRRVAGGGEISKCPIAGNRGSRSISLELIKCFRSVCWWALRDPSVVRIGDAKGERALDDHNHAAVAVLSLLAEEPCRLS